jgi:hypothetical protein
MPAPSATAKLTASRAARLAASWRTRRLRASRRRCSVLILRQRRLPSWRGLSDRARRGERWRERCSSRAFCSRRWRSSSARRARPETTSAWSSTLTTAGWMIPGSSPAILSGSTPELEHVTQAVNVEPQLATFLDDAHRAHQVGVEGVVVGERDLEIRCPAGGGEPHPCPGGPRRGDEIELAPAPAHGHEVALSKRERRLLARRSPLGGLEQVRRPRLCDVLCAVHRELTEAFTTTSAMGY